MVWGQNINFRSERDLTPALDEEKKIENYFNSLSIGRPCDII